MERASGNRKLFCSNARRNDKKETDMVMVREASLYSLRLNPRLIMSA